MSMGSLLGRVVYGRDGGDLLKRPAGKVYLAPAVAAFLLLAPAVWAAEPPSGSNAAETTEANIMLVTAGVLERSQIAHHPLDTDLAGKFLDRYIDDLDGSRSLFLQSDVKRFATYRATLADAIHKNGDTSAAHAIFDRYLRRLAQRGAYVTNLLLTTKLDFTGHDVYAFGREKAERPRDLQAAQKLWQQQIRAEYLQEKLTGKSPDQIVHALLRRKARQLASMTALHGSEILEIYLNALAHVYDPHTDYLGKEEMESLNIAMNLSLFGIGASLENDDGYCRIHQLVPGGPAARSGQLKPGDRVVAIAQSDEEPVDITAMPLTRAAELVRGPKGTTVRLSILPAGAPEGTLPRTVSLMRDEINLEDQRAHARILDLSTGHGQALRLGVIELPSFYAEMDDRKGRATRSATADVARLLAKLQREHVRGVVLDLRTNGGGSLEEAISLTGLFIGQGPVVQTRGLEGGLELGSDTDPTVQYDGPLVVLTSRFSASASEILAGALQDYGRALVVGDASTFGKGTVQGVLSLETVMDKAGFAHAYDPGALKVTMGKFYRPDGASTQLRGVVSDIVLPSLTDLSDVNESSLRGPLLWDSVPAAPHDELNRVQPYLRTLRARSRHRVSTETSFRGLAEDVAWIKKSLAEKSVSLNEEQRRHEQAQFEARQMVREQEAMAHPTPQPTTYRITLKDAASPGLPPPMVAAKNEQEGVPVMMDLKSRSTPNALDRAAFPSGHTPDTDIILEETVKILEDYISLLGAAPHGHHLAGPATSIPAL
jgi:carboxyl-terminal processing protease